MGLISEIDTAPEKIGWLGEAMIAISRDCSENKRYPSLEAPRGSSRASRRGDLKPAVF